LDRRQRPLFRRGEGRVDEGLTEIDFAAVAEILGETLQQPIESAAALPLLKATVARLVGRIACGEIVPRRARPQDPEDAIEDRASVAERPATAIGTAPRPKERFEDGPLTIGEVHAAEYDGDLTDVSGHVPIYEIGSSTTLSDLSDLN